MMPNEFLMKTIIYIILLSLSIACNNSQKSDSSGLVSGDKMIGIKTIATESNNEISQGYVHAKDSVETHIPVTLKLTGDSGYITKRAGLKFLFSQGLTDTADRLWKLLKDRDTIGKYYQTIPGGGYLLCLLNTDINAHACHYLFKISGRANNKEILSKEKYFHGNYACCWKNDFEGFRKLQDFFYLKTCVTGSGYCGRKFYLFKDIHPQDSLNCIYESNYSYFIDKFHSLSSTIKLNGNNLKIQYIERNGIIKEYKNKDYYDNITQDSLQFTVSYCYNNDNWYAADSTYLRDLDF
jgi:hypothetical protein